MIETTKTTNFNYFFNKIAHYKKMQIKYDFQKKKD